MSEHSSLLPTIIRSTVGDLCHTSYTCGGSWNHPKSVDFLYTSASTSLPFAMPTTSPGNSNDLRTDGLHFSVPLHGVRYTIVEYQSRDGFSAALIPLARRCGLAAVVSAYDAGLSASVFA